MVITSNTLAETVTIKNLKQTLIMEYVREVIFTNYDIFYTAEMVLKIVIQCYYFEKR